METRGRLGGRPKGSFEVGTTNNYDKIPEDHICIRCGSDKTTVNFSVVENKDGTFHTVGKCNACKILSQKLKPRELQASKAVRQTEFLLKWDYMSKRGVIKWT